MHHDFSWGLDLLQAVQGYVIQVTSAVEVSLFVSHHLLEKVISASFPLLSFQKQVIC
jgi:hypothetical protein